MKTRIVVHIALNAKGERVGKLFCCPGRFIPFSGNDSLEKDNKILARYTGNLFSTMPSVKHWKSYCKSVEKAVRFQRVTLIGESK
jgi:hypothetical protein